MLNRPKKRADCIDGPRPCPWVACRYHLYLEIRRRVNNREELYDEIRVCNPKVKLEDMPFSCALDTAEQGVMSLEEISQYWDITKERVRQIEEAALIKLAKIVKRRGLDFRDFPQQAQSLWERLESESPGKLFKS